jgi:CheY-like chemotaxis protein
MTPDLRQTVDTVPMHEPLLICYVEDSAEQARRMSDLLHAAVVNPVATFVSGEDLVEYLDGTGAIPGLVLVDLVLTAGAMDGFKTIEALRGRHGFDDVKIAAITETPVEDGGPILDYAKRVGANAMIQKPFSLESLYGLLGLPGWYRMEVLPA